MLNTRSLCLLIIFLVPAIILSGYVEKRNFKLKYELAWSNNYLTWSNFTRTDFLENDYVANIDSEIYAPEEIPSSNFEIYAYMNPSNSFKLHDSMINEYVLKHEQYHFNITEYHARLLRKALVATGRQNLTSEIYDSLFHVYNDRKELMQFNYDSITDHSVNQEDQRYWELKLDDLFRQTSYYENKNLDDYYYYNPDETAYFKHIHLNINNDILTSYPVSEEEAKYGEVYKVVKKTGEQLVYFYKNGKLTNGGVFDTALTKIESDNQNNYEVTFYDSEDNINSKLPYCISKQVNNTNGWTKEYYNSKQERVSFDSTYQLAVREIKDNIFEYTYFNKKEEPIKNKRGTFKKCIQTDALGRVTQHAYYTLNDTPVLNKNFVWTVKLQYNNDHKIEGYQEFDLDETFATYLNSYNLKYEYDERGNLKSEYNFNSNSEIAPNKDGVSIYKFTHDQNDNQTSISRFNAVENPINELDGYHMSVFDYDTMDRMIYYGQFYYDYVLVFDDKKLGAVIYEYPNDSIKYTKNVDVYNNVFNSNDSIAIVKNILNDKGLVKKTIYYDLNNNYAKTYNDVVQIEDWYDVNGNKIKEVSLDSLGNLKPFEADVAIVRWDYDKRNNKIKTAYYNINDELADANQNTTYNIYKYNENNVLVERLNYDKNMEPITFDDHYRSVFVLNRFNKDSIVYSYDLDGKLKKGICAEVSHYNDYGNLVLKSFYDSGNNPVKNSSGVFAIQELYDSNQEYIGYNNLDENGMLINDNQGIAYNHQELNEYGYIISDYYFDKFDSPVIGVEGYHRKEQYWNENGEMTGLKYFGINGKPTPDEFGVAEYKYELNNAGLIKIARRFDPNGNPVNNIYGISETHYKPYLNGLYYLDYELDYLGNIISDDEHLE